MTERVALQMGMRVRLRKPHPCGGDEWTITRIGADIIAVCAQCGRRILLPREEFERRIRQILEGSANTDTKPAP